MASRNPSKDSVFTLNWEILENVKSMKHLGIMIHKSRKFIRAINERLCKANRATHMLKKTLGYSSMPWQR